MTCAEHDRANCSASRCRVLALCLAQLPVAHNQKTANQRAVWSADRGYQLSAWQQHTGEQLVLRIAARLVAWVRWAGRCSRGHEYRPAWQIDHFECGARFSSLGDGGPLDVPYCGNLLERSTHKLNAIASWDERVELSCTECSKRRATINQAKRSEWARIPPIRDGIQELERQIRTCDHSAIDWNYIAVICDVLTESRIACWDDVHRWREPKYGVGPAEKLDDVALPRPRSGKSYGIEQLRRDIDRMTQEFGRWFPPID